MLPNNEHSTDNVLKSETASILTSLAELPRSALEKLLAITSVCEYPKGHILFSENKKNRDIYLIKKGAARIFYLHEGIEVTLVFGIEDDLLISLRSYVEDKPGYETVELLEDCTLLKLSYEDLHKLYDEDIFIANWGRKIAEKELIKTEERLMSRQFRTASQRYAELIEKYPYLLQRVQLGHIASYLGVSQVTLSRIRAEIR